MIIVTGGAGFIGSNLIKGLNEEGINDILIVDNLENSKKHRNLSSLEFIDFIDKKIFLENINVFKNEKIDIIFHQGACTDTMEFNGRFMMDNNYNYSKKLLQFAIKKNIRFIYASSAAVYGSGKNGFEEIKNCEYPLNVYAFSKYMFDQYVRRILEKTNIQIVGLRYFNVYGPQENHKGKMASVIFHFFNQVQNDRKLKLFEGSEKFKRDFVYVKDIIDINLFFLKNSLKRGIFNCGTGRAESFLKIAEIIKSLLCNDIKIEFIPFPEELIGKYQYFTQAELSNLRKAGYNNEFTNIKYGIEKYIRILKETYGYY
jgi:ADP-L-glycero-D-manno-heptose 6-epimerase